MRWLLLVVLALGCSKSPGLDAGVDASADVPPAKRPDVFQPDIGPDATVPEPVQFAFEEIPLSAATLALTGVEFVPGTSEILLLEKDGRVLHFGLDEDAELLGTFMIDDVFFESDCGLLSATFDPDFESNGYVYFAYCISQQFNRITRHVFDPTNYSQVAATSAEILTVGDVAAPKSWHNAGSIGFDPDGAMFAVFGDKRVEDEAQDLTNNLGSLIRIVPNREPDGSGYTAKPGNPFASDPMLSPDIYAYGLRSPWKATLDSRGRFWIGDVGAATYEELNVVTSPGQNFAWPQWEGRCEANCGDFVQPLSYWDRSSESDYGLEDDDTNATDRRVVWVGPEYRAVGGDQYEGGLTGKVLFGDFCAGWVRAAELDAEDRLIYDESSGHLEGVTGVAEGPDGFLYFSTYGNCRTFPYRAGSFWRATLAD